MTQLVLPVEKRLTHCQVSLRGNTHDMECLPAEEDPLHRVKEVREDNDVGGMIHVLGGVNEHTAEEHDVTRSKGNQALVEC